MTHKQISRGEALVQSARNAAASSPDARLPLPDVATWDIFPFEGDLQVKPLNDVALPEPPRSGARGIQCRACERPTTRDLWTDGRWTIHAASEPEAVLSAILEPVQHVDLADLDEDAAADLGRLVVRVARAMEALPGVGRVHVNRWGDGAEHLHIWFFARPAGVLQLRGSSLPDWIDILPAMSPEQWNADLDALTEALGIAPRPQ